MHALSDSLVIATTCTKSSTASAITGFVILLGVVGAVVVLAVLNGRSRKELAAANAELNYLRPENAGLHQWLASYTGVPATLPSTSGPQPEPSVPAGWYPDPAGGRELRYWNGTQWTANTSDRGATATDS